MPWFLKGFLALQSLTPQGHFPRRISRAAIVATAHPHWQGGCDGTTAPHPLPIGRDAFGSNGDILIATETKNSNF